MAFRKINKVLFVGVGGWFQMNSCYQTEQRLWHKEIEFWMPHTSMDWILKYPLHSGPLLNVSQGSENPPFRSSCRQSANPPSPPRKILRCKRCKHNQATAVMTGDIHTDDELCVTASYEHRCILFFRPLRHFGRHGSSRWGGEGNGQVAGVLRGSSRTGETCWCDSGAAGGAKTPQHFGRRAVVWWNLLCRGSLGQNVDHRSLVPLHIRTQL